VLDGSSRRAPCAPELRIKSERETVLSPLLRGTDSCGESLWAKLLGVSQLRMPVCAVARL